MCLFLRTDIRWILIGRTDVTLMGLFLHDILLEGLVLLGNYEERFSVGWLLSCFCQLFDRRQIFFAMFKLKTGRKSSSAWLLLSIFCLRRSLHCTYRESLLLSEELNDKYSEEPRPSNVKTDGRSKSKSRWKKTSANRQLRMRVMQCLACVTLLHWNRTSNICLGCAIRAHYHLIISIQRKNEELFVNLIWIWMEMHRSRWSVRRKKEEKKGGAELNETTQQS